MELVLLIGIPGSGKSSLCASLFWGSHLRLSLDVLRTRSREAALFEACLRSQTRVVVDNTNASRQERARFIGPAREARFRVVGYYLRTDLREALERNSRRLGIARVPDVGVFATHSRLQVPCFGEGFDALFYAQADGSGGFDIEPWRAEGEGAEVLEGGAVGGSGRGTGTDEI